MTARSIGNSKASVTASSNPRPGEVDGDSLATEGSADVARSFKNPEEKLTFVYEFADIGDATVVSVNAGTPKAEARGAGALITQDGAAIVTADQVSVRWQGGIAGESYLTTVTITDSAGDVHTRTGEILVTAPGFAIPEGVSSRYLTGEEYALRFGTAEAVRLTDETRSGVADSAKLEAAIGDASDFADGYIATRYTLPLLAAPRVVKSIVAALAREALHKTKPTPEVTAAADRARTQLRDIAAGRMTLPVEGGGTVAATTDQSAMTSRDGSSAFRDALSGYSLNRVDYDPCWRR